jgi:integrase
MVSTRALAPLPSVAIVAAAVAGGVPAYVNREQVAAIVAVLPTMRHRLLVRALWQSGGRATEVLRLRPCDLDRAEGALLLDNLKQGRPARKRVYVSAELVAELAAYARELRLRPTDYLFSSRQSGRLPMTGSNLLKLIRSASVRAGVEVIGARGPRPAVPLDFRHGAAVNMIRSMVPLSEVGQQLGHARADSTLIYLKLANPERRAVADRVTW